MKTRPGQNGGVDRSGVSGRSSRGLYLALVALGIAAFSAGPGCLNPRPEELPSSQNTVAAPDPVFGGAPVRETCSDNPNLVGCALPDEGVGAPQGSPATGAPGFSQVGDAGADTQADAGAAIDGEAEPTSDAGP